MDIEVTDTPKPVDDQIIIDRTREFNSNFLPNEYRCLSVYVRDENRNVIGGLTGKTFWNWLHIEYLWVAESEREKNIGSKIMKVAESEARKRGCIGSMLDTFTFQAPEFYEKLGYEKFGALEDYQEKYERIFYAKSI